MNKYFFRKHWLLTILFLLCGLIIVLTFFRQRINSNSTQKSKSEIVDDFDAKIIGKRENSILVEAFDYRKEILVSTKLLEEKETFSVGDIVNIGYNGLIEESDPLGVTALCIKKVRD